MPTPVPTPVPTPSPSPALPQLTELPPDIKAIVHGVSLLGGWLPLTVELVSVVALVLVLARLGRRWWLVWVPVSAALGVAVALAARTYMNSEGLASDPAPLDLWVWTALAAAAITLAVFGWRRSRWWRRVVSVLLIPLTALTALMSLNRWVGYYPTVQAAWGAVTAGPLPHQVEAAELPSLRGTAPTDGKLVEVTIPDTVGFKHRSEYVYLPPAWFAGPTPPALPVVMMVAGEFNTPADWMRSGSAMATIDGFASAHAGMAPIFVFVDSGGRFNNDTECVNGPRGNSADHLTKDVRPYVVSKFGASASPANWGVVGWSMGGTCAIDLTVMHPELFSTFVDIAGDHGPTAGTKEQTIERLYAGDAERWAAFDPATVMRKHGPYQGVSGWFADTIKPDLGDKNPFGKFHAPQRDSDTPLGFGGHDDWHDADQTGAAQDLCAVAKSVNIDCAIHTLVSFHTWQFAQRAFSDALPWMAGQLHTPAK
ncbi:S-formylglutathione hydrolase FrmB [Mycobacterium sp. MAA66]|uniref:alpha/beta hydrolase n=1 Tax=Mycobacterium sp. MAA66 TaxID=3156297 RepID=UPI003510D5BF